MNIAFTNQSLTKLFEFGVKSDAHDAYMVLPPEISAFLPSVAEARDKYPRECDVPPGKWCWRETKL